MIPSSIVLAGGKSSRMGRPKALLPFDNEPLIAHIVRTLHRLSEEVVVVAAPDQELPAMPVALVRDEIPHQGPVGGIYYGLKASTGEFCFVTSCDSAFLNPTLIGHLLSRIADCDVVVPHWAGRVQPLHAVYRRTVLPLLEAQLARRELRPVYLFDRVRTCRIDEEEIRRFDPDGSSFFNMNTPEDYAAALERWRNERAPSVPIHCTVELFGVARLLAKTTEVSLELAPGATYSHLFAALAVELPVLSGRVISPDGSALLEGYACNVNGLDFVRAGTATVNSGDRIVILSADAGG